MSTKEFGGFRSLEDKRRWAREYARKRNAADPQRHRDQVSRWRANNPERVKELRKKDNALYLKKRTPEQKALAVARTREWVKANPERAKANSDAYRLKVRLEVFEAYGGKCACCGETASQFLTIDHINGGGSKHRKSLSRNFYMWLRANDFPKDGFRILCMNCNFAEGRKGGCPHKRAP